MASSLLKGFVSGVSKYGLDKMSRAEDEEREIRKLKLLEQLRKDTAKEMAMFEEELRKKRVDKSMSTDDFTTGKRTLRNEYGEDVGMVDLPVSALEEYKSKQAENALDRQYKEAQIGNFALDNARADRQLAISEGHLDLARKEASRRTSLESGGKDGILLAEKDKIFSALKAAGVPEAEVLTAEARWYDGVNNKKWTKDQQRIFLSRLSEILAKRRQAEALHFPEPKESKD